MAKHRITGTFCLHAKVIHLNCGDSPGSIELREICEFRIPEKLAGEWLHSSDGKITKSGTVRIVETPRGSDTFDRVLDAERMRAMEGKRFFLFWFISREYSDEELSSAELLLVNIYNRFEPAGEECGVVYTSNPEGLAECGNRIGPLILKCSRFRGTSFSASIAGEVVVAPELQAMMSAGQFSGADFGPVMCESERQFKKGWKELIATSVPVSVSERTKTGITPFDSSVAMANPVHENIGLNVVSEVYLDANSWNGADFVVSAQTVGYRRGLLRPRRLYFISQRLYRSLRKDMRRGLAFEVAHLVRS